MALKRLAESDFHEVDSAAWQKLAPCFESESFPEVLNETNRAVGFRFEPASINHYIGEVTRRIGGGR